MSAESEALQEIDARIAMVRDNLRELVDRASGYSGAADDELTAQRIADQEAELERLKSRRTLLAG
jgi:precorrin-2 methylase